MNKNIGQMSELEIYHEFLSYKGSTFYKEESSIRYYYDHISCQKYSSALKQIVSLYGESNLHNLASRLLNEFNSCMEKLDCMPSEVGKNQSWVYWDIAKQFYLFNHPEESNKNYKIENPFVSTDKQSEIVERHIGWEIYTYNKFRFLNSSLTNCENSSINNELLMDERINLHSYEYYALGKAIVACYNTDFN
jgi:hypothetical protein